jgi:hypothetical protein
VDTIPVTYYLHFNYNIMKKKNKIIKLGVVGVDSGQLMICDPCYINSEFKTPDSKGIADHAHAIYRHKKDGKLWQYCYDEQPANPNVNPYPGNGETIIPEYGLTPNDLVMNGSFEKTNLDPTPHIPLGEFSYRGISKLTSHDGNQGGQLNYKMGHPGVAVAFCSGLGDGRYDIFAEIVDAGNWGPRIKKVWIELITDKELTVKEGLSGTN